MVFWRVGCVVVGVLLLAACGADKAPPNTVSASAVPAEKSRDNVTCAEHFSQARQAILGTLRGTQHRPLTALASELSVDVQPSGMDANSRLTRSCSFHNRRLLSVQTTRPARSQALPAACDALVEHIDKHCLQPLQQRGEPLSRQCHRTLLGLSGSAEDIDRMLGDEANCASLTGRLL